MTGPRTETATCPSISITLQSPFHCEVKLASRGASFHPSEGASQDRRRTADDGKAGTAICDGAALDVVRNRISGGIGQRHRPIDRTEPAATGVIAGDERIGDGSIGMR